jgi:capsular polysaccharide biosynthesis protein
MQNKDTDIRELISIIWDNKIKILIVSFIFFVISLTYSFTLNDKFKSEAILMISDQSSSSTQIPSNYSSIASMAGLSLPQSDSENKINLGLEVMLSREFLYSFIRDKNLMVSIMASKGWDPITDQIIIDENIYDPIKNIWVSSRFPQTGPSIHDAYEEFLSYITLEKNKLTGFITLSITSPSPINSRDWVNLLIEDINVVTKNKDLSKTNKALDFLNEQVSKTTLKELRDVFYSIIESELRTKMLASVSSEYLFSIIDKPIVAERKISPNRVFISIIGAILGFIIGLTYVLMLTFFREEKSN